MNNITKIYELLNLNSKKYKIVEWNEKKTTKEDELETIILTIKCLDKFVFCPYCGLRTNKRQDLKEITQKITLKHINISNQKIIELKPIKRYFRCVNKGCKHHFMERFDIESVNGFHTIDFENYVIKSLGYLTGSDIARLNNSSPNKIYKIFQTIEANKLNENGMKILENLNEIYLGIDEHSFRGKDMVLIITELKTKKLITILPNTIKESLKNWINSIPLKIQVKVKGIETDMNKYYAKTIKENLIGTPVHSVDKYHLFQEANRMVDEVRILNSWLLKMSFIKTEDIGSLVKTKKLKTISKKIKKEDIKQINEISTNRDRMMKYKPKAEQRLRLTETNGEEKKFRNAIKELQVYNEITLDYFLENGYRTIFLTREKNLSELQNIRVNQIFREYDYHGYLVEAWTIKEDFMDAIDELNLGEVNRIIGECKTSEHYRIQQFGRTLVNWYDGIKGYIEHSTPEFRFTNAFTEGMNNQCKIIQRVSYGWKYKDNYFRKLFLKSMINKSKSIIFDG